MVLSFESADETLTSLNKSSNESNGHCSFSQYNTLGNGRQFINSICFVFSDLIYINGFQYSSKFEIRVWYFPPSFWECKSKVHSRKHSAFLPPGCRLYLYQLIFRNSKQTRVFHRNVNHALQSNAILQHVTDWRKELISKQPEKIWADVTTKNKSTRAGSTLPSSVSSTHETTRPFIALYLTPFQVISASSSRLQITFNQYVFTEPVGYETTIDRVTEHFSVPALCAMKIHASKVK